MLGKTYSQMNPPQISNTEFDLAKLTIQLCGHDLKPWKLSIAMSTIVFDYIMNIANQWKEKLDTMSMDSVTFNYVNYAEKYRQHFDLANDFKRTGFKKRIMSEYYSFQRLKKELEAMGEPFPF